MIIRFPPEWTRTARKFVKSCRFLEYGTKRQAKRAIRQRKRADKKLKALKCVIFRGNPLDFPD